jgi:hypothetical protein
MNTSQQIKDDINVTGAQGYFAYQTRLSYTGSSETGMTQNTD